MNNGAMRPLAILIFSALLTSTLVAADLSGTWMGLIPPSGRRLAQDIEFRLAQHGDKLSGKLYRGGESSPIVEGEIDARGEVWFVVETREQAGNQINIVEYRFEGVVCEGGIDLTRERAAARDAVSGVVIPVRRPGNTDEEDRRRRFHSFRLERLF
jgi:hypothetical protein